MTDDAPFEDVEGEETRFRLPKRKWRELLFIGALVPEPETDCFVRDPTRSLPPFRKGDLFPEGARFAIKDEGDWVEVTRVSS